ncbi:hypothetical protein P865_13305 [Brucella abortus 82]|nr:hypothetical protein P865_13305 [Brucella abortus 82]
MCEAIPENAVSKVAAIIRLRNVFNDPDLVPVVLNSILSSSYFTFFVMRNA